MQNGGAQHQPERRGTRRRNKSPDRRLHLYRSKNPARRSKSPDRHLRLPRQPVPRPLLLRPLRPVDWAGKSF